jgi:hypothetical protein
LQNALEADAGDDRPIVIGRPLAFLELEHYASPTLAGRLYYLTGAKPGERTLGNVLFDEKGAVLAEFLPFRAHLATYGPFVARHKRFVATEPGWVVRRLTAEGADVRLKGSVDGSSYYEITVK